MQAVTQATTEFVKQNWAPLVCGFVVVAVLPLIVGYVVLVERKIMADMQARLGPMRVGPHGLLQPIADAVKLLIKEDIIPDDADKLVFWLAPVLSVGAALLAMAGLAIGPAFQIAQGINIGILFVVGVSAMGIFGIVLGGWASNSHYSLIGALRSSAQLVSYETAAGMALVCGLLFAGTLNITSIVQAQYDQGIWFGLLAPVAFFVYLVASIAETNRAPFDLPEAESELVAGYMTEFSGFRWSLYFLAEYTNMIVVASVATTLFLGGWLRPFPRTHWLDFIDFLPPLLMVVIGVYCLIRVPKQPVRVQQLFMLAVAGMCFAVAVVLAAPMLGPLLKPSLASAMKPFFEGIHGGFWFIFKVGAYIYFFMWLRFTLPRYRFDQLMRLGWHFLIPLSIINVLLIGIAMIVGQYFDLTGPSLLLTTIPASVIALMIALFILAVEQKKEPQQQPGAATPDSYA
ncbi:MAG: NADH-quinone oxidoreductase subunit H [Acidobacteria bacterium]|nr:MAG: NADH-quinone oxidoreductase subunit H [Acidobacteriota bacterium]